MRRARREAGGGAESDGDSSGIGPSSSGAE